jgi:hypothetical protein
MVKVTFTFDEQTVESLKRTAARLKKPSSMVVREAIQEYSSRADNLTTAERQHLLKALDRIAARPASRSDKEVDSELKSIRTSRRAGGRRSRGK